MKKALVAVLAVIGAIAIVCLLVAGLVTAVSQMGKPGVPGKVVLEANFETSFVETVPEDPIAQAMMGKQPTLRGVIEALHRGAEDDRVVGLFATIGSVSIGMAQIEEIRDAVAVFRESGKPAIVFSETFGEVGPGNTAYYLATAFDEIYLQPSGDIGLTGFYGESQFLAGVFEKLDIVQRMDHRYEFKNAKNMFTEKEFTAAHREAASRLMESQFEQLVAGIADSRGLGEDEIRGLIDRGPYLGQEAVDAKLVDGLAYRDEVLDSLEEKVGDDTERLFLAPYLKRAGGVWKKGETVALIYGVGPVMRGTSAFDPVFGMQTMGSATVAGALRDAIEDEVEAIVFRVDSPGGSYVASDTIWRETIRAKEAGIPVIVSMGNVAGSGGYFVAMAADAIVAQPSTITASIGVLGGKRLTRPAWAKLGLSFDDVSTSANATMWSGGHDYTEYGWSRFQAWLDRVYEDFTSKVAEGRGLPKEKVLEIAKGRVWTGADALELGLVDELGGLTTAIRLAKEAADIPADDSIRLKLYPSPKTPFQTFFGEGPDNSGAIRESLVRALQIVQPMARFARDIGLVEEPGALMTPQVPTAN